MMGFAFLWRWWTDAWSASGGRARVQCAALAVAFAALAAAAGLLGDVAVAAVASVVAGIALALAAFAPRLARALASRPEARP